MRILIITPMFAPSYHYGGPPRSGLGLARGLLEAGHAVSVIASNGNGAADLSITANQWTSFEGVPVIYLKRRRPGNYFYTPTLAPVLQACVTQFDAVIIRAVWTYFNWRSTIILRRHQIPYFQYVLGTFDDWAMRHKGFKKKIYWNLIEKYAFLHATGVVALSQPEAAQIQYMGIERPIAVIPNGVDLDQFSQATELPSFYIPELKGDRYILYMGRLHPKKGIERLIEAFELVARQFSTYRLVLAGSGEEDYITHLRSLVNQYRCETKVIFPGFVTGNLRVALLKNASIFVLPSFSEGLPMGALEALGCGIPVIITPQCYLPDVFTYGAGIISENEPVLLARAMLEILSKPGLAENMSKNGLKMVEKHYSWRSSAEKLVSFMNDSIGICENE